MSLRIEKPTKYWPVLTFLNIEFGEINSDDCTECFELKENFKKENNFCWKEVFENKKFPNLFCKDHQSCQINYEPLIFLINKEQRSKRGNFITYSLSNICPPKTEEITQIFPYFEKVKNPSMFIPSKSISSALEEIKQKLELNLNNNITNQFFHLLINEDWTNSTIIINDGDSTKMNYLLDEMLKIGFIPNVVRDGRKVFLIEIEELGIKFLRSNNYFNGNEYQIAKLFDVEVQKKFFPNRFQDFGYKGSIPDSKFFFEFSDTETERLEKIEYICNFKKNNFNWIYSKELMQFCEEKLTILSLCFLKFIHESFSFQILLQKDDEFKLIHPLASNICSLSSFTYKLYKLFYLNDYEIFAIKNEFGGNLSKEVSAQEYEWSCFMQFKYPEREYRSAFNHPLGAKIFKECYPDLYSAKDQEAVFYNGCFYHAHVPGCLLNPNVNFNTNHVLFNKSYQEINDVFNKKIALLLLNNPDEIKKVTIVWECQYLQERGNDLELKTFLDTTFQKRPLQRLRPCTAVRGSFTECYALKWLQSENPSDLFYCLDFNGMYSHIGLTSKFGVGAYKIIVGNDLKYINLKNGQFYFKNDVNYMVGVMMVSILPPKNLFYPFLPYRLNDESSIFTLCAKCSENETKNCSHSDIERSFISVYFISELVFALQLGYKINEIYECHYFEKSDFILRDFINKLACLKLQNSNLFSNLTTIEEKESYCDYLNAVMQFSEPFKLKVDNVQFNETKRNLYKTMMNSIFGKLEQRSDKPKTVYVNSQEELEKYYFSDSTITSIYCINNDVCELELKTPNEKLPPNRENNSYIGGEIVAYGRILMYQTIQKIDSIGKIFYVDCDSCFFTLPKSVQNPLEVSDAFGAFKNVFKGEILSFFCIGPKNYAICYKTENNKVKHVTKIKGLSLSSYYLQNEINTSTFNYFMSKYLTEEIEKKQIAQLRCRKEKKSRKVFKKLEIVRFSNQITNRRIVIKNCKYATTVPFGFKLN